MLSCQHMVSFFSLKPQRKPSAIRRFKLWLHLLICPVCRNRRRRLRLLEKLCPRHFASVQMDFPAGALSDETRRILQSLPRPSSPSLSPDGPNSL